MTDDKKMVKKENQEVAETTAPETVYTPAVDICEDANRIRLLADMPGADQSSVDVSVENGVLKVEGKGAMNAPDGLEPLGQEYAVGRYHRDFTLSDQIDIEGIKAKTKNGVLEVILPKRDEVKTRKIEITS